MNSTKNTKSKIALIGPYPPPYGGISIHIQRLKERLEKEGCDCVVYELGRQGKPLEENIIRVKNVKRWLLKYLFFAKEGIIHFHNPDWRMRVIMGLMGLLGKKTVISIHGESLNDSLKEGGWFRKQIIKFALKHTSFIIAANESIKNLVSSLGVKQQSVACISAFIPPTVKAADHNKVPQYVWDFIHEHEPVIAGNAFSIRFYNEIDLYGLDMVVALTARLGNRYPKLGIVFCLPSIGDKDYFRKLNEEIKKRGLNEHILFITEPLDEVYPIWEESDIFVRPTVTDGDALSIREALYLKTPVVTSDTCPRPKGVILFKNRDIDSFTENVEEVLVSYTRFKKELESIKVDSGFDKILEVYNNF